MEGLRIDIRACTTKKKRGAKASMLKRISCSIWEIHKLGHTRSHLIYLIIIIIFIILIKFPKYCLKLNKTNM